MCVTMKEITGRDISTHISLNMFVHERDDQGV